MNPDLSKLHPYPFERLATLKEGVTPPAALPHIALSIGEPRHTPPAFVLDALRNKLEGLASYPMALGLPELREAIVGWATRRFGLRASMLDPARHVLPVSGTREGLFAFAQAVVDRMQRAPVVMMPNPFYQIYEGAALLAGAEPYYLNTTAANGFVPDLDTVTKDIWRRCQLVYVCSPGNPTGAVLERGFYRRLLELADEHDFIVASDECYSELYDDEATPPPGLLGVCAELGRDDFSRCVVFHSLSKRSNVPGLRSGFAAGDAEVMAKFRLYRTYHGCAVPVPTQFASIPAWNDEAHVVDNRALYRRKFDDALRILTPVLEVQRPPAAFYLWLPVPGGDDEAFVRELFRAQNLTLLPGSYLSRMTPDGDPGAGFVRVSLVPSIDECADAMRRIAAFVGV
ncbi:MAG: succinyldiaminopimelate transaminase [Xanthomonadaceae bacterium]|nr:succinyldiaminopimelate transaminase [Xanthomonadaceae bacterium]